MAVKGSPARTAAGANEEAGSFYTTLQEIVRHFQSRDLDAVCEYGISVRECHALELLSREPLSVNGLAKPLGLDKSTVSRLVQRLVSEKLVIRTVDQRDGRAVVLALTAKGRRLYESAYGDSIACYRTLLGRVTPDERAHVVEALQLALRLLRER